ncbi:hypothetical protein [Nocardia jinanensis]|uniref:Uncharacterized protein n=1 Tax=Nocardia jinanensis TaxID=382504 RepID=A0A917VQ91_9NOCA|nr:hypothetical protein [Nocardia jinanensis]GGL03537.1 hypothetical protein GCM10011588_17830 [Nocardia jinanensis]
MYARRRRARPAHRAGERTAALIIPYIAALQPANWSLPVLRADITPAAEAGAEATAIVAAQTGGSRSRAPKWAVRLIRRLLPALTPFDPDRYLNVHFTKVADQTELMLDGWIAEGESLGLPVARLRRLRTDFAAGVAP